MELNRALLEGRHITYFLDTVQCEDPSWHIKEEIWGRKKGTAASSISPFKLKSKLSSIYSRVHIQLRNIQTSMTYDCYPLGGSNLGKIYVCSPLMLYRRSACSTPGRISKRRFHKSLFAIFTHRQACYQNLQ